MSGSTLVGPNHKLSSVNANFTGVPALALCLEENGTPFVPVGELEVGVEWGKMIGQGTPAQGQVKGKLVWARAGVTGQIWGNVGFLSVTDNNPSFDNRSLHLAGFSLTIGIEF
jgi:hypothetical protein